MKWAIELKVAAEHAKEEGFIEGFFESFVESHIKIRLYGKDDVSEEYKAEIKEEAIISAIRYLAHKGYHPELIADVLKMPLEEVQNMTEEK